MAGMGNRRRKRLNTMELSEFCRQLAAMTGSGITLSRALGILKLGEDNRKICEIYENLEKQMHQGSPISDAMENSGVFPEMMINMFRAGEASGKMKETSAKLAEYYQKEHRMNSRIRAALLYPEIVSVTALMAVLIIFLVVMPTIEPLIAGMEVPAITRFLMAFSNFIAVKWYLAILIAAAPSVCWKILGRDRRFRCWWDKEKLRIPIIGRQLRIIYTARFARSQRSLYSSGLPMIDSLRIAGKTLGNSYLEGQFSKVVHKVQNGEMLSGAIKSVDGFDKKLAPIIFVGEETGKLDTMLEGIADSYEYESEAALSKLISLIEPAMILILGAVICVIMIGIMLPLWNMYGYIE